MNVLSSAAAMFAKPSGNRELHGAGRTAASKSERRIRRSPLEYCPQGPSTGRFGFTRRPEISPECRFELRRCCHVYVLGTYEFE